MLVFSIFCDFSLIHKVFINIQTPEGQFDNNILLHSYISLQKTGFDSFFNVLFDNNSLEISLGEERGIWIARRLFPTVFCVKMTFFFLNYGVS